MHKSELFYMILDIVICDSLISIGFPSSSEHPMLKVLSLSSLAVSECWCWYF